MVLLIGVVRINVELWRKNDLLSQKWIVPKRAIEMDILIRGTFVLIDVVSNSMWFQLI